MSDFTPSTTIILPDEQATLALATAVAKSLPLSPTTIFLHGPLGAGKSCFTRSLLHSLGWTQKVKSPTYTLVEPYIIHQRAIYHFDLYRLSEPEELEILGIRDYLTNYDLLIIEWPTKGQGFLPLADLEINFTVLPNGRQVVVSCNTDNGRIILKHALNI